MRKLILAAAGALASAAVVAGASQAWNPVPYYVYTYYETAAQTNIVGYNFQACQSNGQITNNFQGTTTSHYTRQWTGYCGSGGDIPL